MMWASKGSVVSALLFSAGTVMADSYANDQNPTVFDTPQVVANFPDVEGIEILSPAFVNPSGVPGAFARGTLGPTPQDTLGE